MSIASIILPQISTDKKFAFKSQFSDNVDRLEFRALVHEPVPRKYLRYQSQAVRIELNDSNLYDITVSCAFGADYKVTDLSAEDLVNLIDDRLE